MAQFLIIDEDIHPSGVELLRKTGSVEVIPHTTPEENVLPKLGGVVGVLLRKGRMTARMIEAAPNLKIIARHGVGVDSVDLVAAAKRNVLVTITGTANSLAVAEYTIAMMLAVARSIPAASQELNTGRWSPNNYLGVELQGRTLGVVGFGQIGRLVCQRALALGMKVLVADPLVGNGAIEAAGASSLSYDEVLPLVDFLSFHVRLTPETRGLFGPAHLAIAKPGIRIINTSRGGICDEDALLAGVNSGVIAGVALDTFAQEPLPDHHPLLRHPRAVLTPHIAGQTEEAMINMSMTAAQSIVDCFEGRRPHYVYEASAA